MEGMAPAMPFCHQAMRMAKGIMSRCGKGSQTDPIWRMPGLSEAMRRRAMWRWATASPYSRSILRVKQYPKASTESSAATMPAKTASWRRERTASLGLAGTGTGSRPRGRLLDVRELAEERKAFLDFVRIKLLQALRAESLHGKRAHDAAIEHGFAEHRRCERRLGGDVAEESTSEGIARSRGIDDFRERQCGCAEWNGHGRLAGERPVAEERGCTVLAVLDYECPGAHVEHLARGEDEVWFLRQHFHFGVVDQKRVETFEHAGQVFGVVLDPVVHGVAAHHLHLWHLAADVFLESGIDVGEE